MNALKVSQCNNAFRLCTSLEDDDMYPASLILNLILK